MGKANHADNIDPEAATLLNRLQARLDAEPKRWRAERYRVMFIARGPIIAKALDMGHPMAAVWRALRDDEGSLMTYGTYHGVHTYLFEISWVPNSWVLIGLAVGGAFGAASSAAAIRRHLREI